MYTYELSHLCVLQIVEFAYEHKMATLYPEPEDKEAFVRSLIYSPDYDEFAVDSYHWPKDAMAIQSCKLWRGGETEGEGHGAQRRSDRRPGSRKEVKETTEVQYHQDNGDCGFNVKKKISLWMW